MKVKSFVPVILVLVMTACINGNHKQDAIEVSDNITTQNVPLNFETTDSTGIPQPPASPQKEEDSKDHRQQQTPVVPVDWDKKIIKTATVNMEVKDYRLYTASLPGTVKKYGGYISHEQQAESTEKIENNITIKVPVAQFENALNELVQGGSKVNQRQVQSEDVTTQLVDGRARLEAKKGVRQRYLELLKAAKNMEEILNVQSEINSIQEEIESMTGRINFLGHSSAMSTINLTYQQWYQGKITEPANPSFLSKIKIAFIQGSRWMSELIIGLVSIWPLLILFSFGIYLLRKKVLQSPVK